MLIYGSFVLGLARKMDHEGEFGAEKVGLG
jgi:hypothetical protein